MAQTSEGAEKLSAQKLGITLDELRARKLKGEKWCTSCKEWHRIELFGFDRSRGDGRDSRCRESKNRQTRAAYVQRSLPPRGRSFVPARDGDRKQARRRINYFVDAGLIPRPSTLPCSLCGHEYESPWDGDRPARHEYHHHKGYGARHHEDVVVFCSMCHHLEG